MFKLFGKKNKKTEVGKKANGEPMSSEEIRAQAMANAKAARESIGEETLEKIAAALQKKQQSTAEKAKACGATLGITRLRRFFCRPW